MSARELINQVASLPPQERTLFEQLFQTMNGGKGAPVPASRSDWPDFGERLATIYGENVAPDSQNIIDEGRGDR